MPVPLLVFSPRSTRRVNVGLFVFFANPTRVFSPPLLSSIFFVIFIPFIFIVALSVAFDLSRVALSSPRSRLPSPTTARVTDDRVSRRRFKVPLSGCSARNVYNRCFRETQSRAAVTSTAIAKGFPRVHTGCI